MAVAWPLIGYIVDSTFVSHKTRLLNMIRFLNFMYIPLCFAMFLTPSMSSYYVIYNVKYLVVNLAWAALWKVLRVEMNTRIETSMEDVTDVIHELGIYFFVQLFLPKNNFYYLL